MIQTCGNYIVISSKLLSPDLWSRSQPKSRDLYYLSNVHVVRKVLNRVHDRSGMPNELKRKKCTTLITTRWSLTWSQPICHMPYTLICCGFYLTQSKDHPTFVPCLKTLFLASPKDSTTWDCPLCHSFVGLLHVILLRPLDLVKEVTPNYYPSLASSS